MKIVCFALLLLLASYGNAQNIDNVKFRIHYAAKFKVVEGSKSIRQDEKILDIGTNSSKFYSLWETKIRETQDSVIAHGGTFSDVMNAVGKLPYTHSYQYYAVYKNYPRKGTLTYTDKVLKEFIYEEAMERPVWKVIPQQDAQIAGYACQKAETTYRGRTWNVWYTTDIPISDGPWKLYGLPGLILKAVDAKDDFLFECIEIENIEKEPMYIPKYNYLKCTAEKLKQMHIKMRKDPYGFFRQLGMDPGQGYGADGKPLVYKEEKPVLLEY